MATMMAGAIFGTTVIVWHRLRPTLESHVAQFTGPSDIGRHAASVSHSMEQQNRPIYIPYAPAIAVGTMAALWYLDYSPDRLLG
jgi:hypothetical protein